MAEGTGGGVSGRRSGGQGWCRYSRAAAAKGDGSHQQALQAVQQLSEGGRLCRSAADCDDASSPTADRQGSLSIRACRLACTPRQKTRPACRVAPRSTSAGCIAPYWRCSATHAPNRLGQQIDANLVPSLELAGRDVASLSGQLATPSPRSARQFPALPHPMSSVERS